VGGSAKAIDPVFIAIWLVIGAVAGWLASLIVTGGGLGLIWDIIVGIVGAVIAGYLLPRYIGGGFIPEVINAVIGAIILLVIVRFGKPTRRDDAFMFASLPRAAHTGRLSFTATSHISTFPHPLLHRSLGRA
jgi:uncharacterized membrane protein YeaQ/YmgE (transglycosylase-associated protein family)